MGRESRRTRAQAHGRIGRTATRSVYLQQDLLRHFIEAASPQERFAAVSELVGAGRVTELQDSLERSKKAWTTVTHQRQEELRPSRERLAIVDARLAELTERSSQASPSITPQDWNEWWQNLTGLGVKALRVESSAREAPSAINNAIKELDAQRRLTERKLQALSAIQGDIKGLASQPPSDVQPLRDSVAKLRKEVEDLKRVTSEEQARLAEQRRHQAELKEMDEQLRALAALALKHLGDHCPVCAQTYDRDATRRRLENLAKSGAGGPQAASVSDKFNELLSALTAKEKEVATAELGLRTAEQSLNAQRIAEQTLTKRLTELGIPADDREPALVRAVAEAETLTKRLSELQQIGESLALRLAQSSAMAAIEELRREADTLRQDIAVRDKSITARIGTGDLAQSVIEALREAASAVVEERLIELNPLLQKIWSRIDPHPAFRLVSFFSQVFRGKGQLSTIVSDPIEDKRCELPERFVATFASRRHKEARHCRRHTPISKNPGLKCTERNFRQYYPPPPQHKTESRCA